MPEGNFSQKQKENKEKELLRQRLENSLEVKIDPAISLENLLTYIRGNNRTMFIMDGNFNIFLTTDYHNKLLTRLGLEEKDCLLSAGSFQIRPNRTISFLYHESKLVIAVIPEITQKKIKEFLKSKGIEFYR